MPAGGSESVMATAVTPGSRFRLFSSSSKNASRSEEHTSELQSQSNLVCRLLLEKNEVECLGDETSAIWIPRSIGNRAQTGQSASMPTTSALWRPMSVQHANICPRTFFLAELQSE